MEIIWIITGGLFLMAGFIGSFLPVLPGPPLSYIGLLFLQLTPDPPFELSFLIAWAIVVVVVYLVDNFIPVYGTRKFGGSATGMFGCISGLIIGIIVFPPFGIIIGPVAGAFIGEMIAGKSSGKALRAAMGAFAGFLFSVLLKVSICSVLAYYFVINL